MNITYTLQPIAADAFQASIIFTREDGTTHIDSVNIPKDQDGNTIQDDLTAAVESQYQYVLNKQDSIDWY